MSLWAIRRFPEAADRCVVNGRTPFEWMIGRYQVKTDKASDSSMCEMPSC